MHEKYVKLFRQIIRTVITLSEQVANYNHEKKDEKGETTANTMKADYEKLSNKFNQTPITLTKAEYAKLLVGVLIIVNNIENRISSERKAIDNYKTEVIPKLEQIINDSIKSDEDADKLAKELFKISEDK